MAVNERGILSNSIDGRIVLFPWSPCLFEVVALDNSNYLKLGFDTKFDFTCSITWTSCS